jgi:hypothetical protein
VVRLFAELRRCKGKVQERSAWKRLILYLAALRRNHEEGTTMLKHSDDYPSIDQLAGDHAAYHDELKRIEKHCQAECSRQKTQAGRAFRKVLEAKQRAVIERFADLTGWQYDDCGFRPCDIGKVEFGYDYQISWNDQLLYFRRDGVNIAIVGQPYDLDRHHEELNGIARRHGLRWQVPPNSTANIWYPGWTYFIVLTLTEVLVHWLPEQEVERALDQIRTPKPRWLNQD